jgi:hypothetical protein
MLLCILIICLVFFLFFLYRHFIVDFYENKEKIRGPRKKILNIVLFSHGDVYDKMYELSKTFYSRYEDYVDTIYYTYRPDISQEYSFHVEKNILYIKGSETYIPGILRKTVKAFEYVPQLEKQKGKKYDYIIRSNISTFINFDKLEKMIYRDSVDYGAGYKLGFGKEWRDEYNGIKDDRYANIPYPSGTSMIFSRELFEKMLSKIDKFDEKVIDDVAIGKLIKEYFPNYTLFDYGAMYHIVEDVNKKNANKYIFFRNRQPKRENDLVMMKKLMDFMD